ncbi:MAG: FAD-dependent oxidoreductase, partial [Bauldia sp.]|nr:FAD-dependent oxidoreductase [Bauldia sp.]
MASIAIIGGGIIGSAAAVWLIADGHRVTVFERAPEGRPASTGNAGLIALPEISPLARPGILTSVPGWL